MALILPHKKDATPKNTQTILQNQKTKNLKITQKALISSHQNTPKTRDRFKNLKILIYKILLRGGFV